MNIKNSVLDYTLQDIGSWIGMVTGEEWMNKGYLEGGRTFEMVEGKKGDFEIHWSNQ